MKIITATTIVVFTSTASSFYIPNPFAQTPLKLNLGLDKINLLYDMIAASLDANKNFLVNAIASYMNEPFESISPETKTIWLDLMLQFPLEVSRLNFMSKPKKFGTKGKFDFHVTDEKLPNYQLRVKATPQTLGIDSVKQFSGYIDVEDEDKHFFYWFFESRNNPKNDPVILWLNGGPGCSSMTGLLFELGPSSIGKDIKPIHNPHSWNNNASVIFLDQPVNVGYSYSSRLVSNTIAAGKDVYAFLELFFKQFPQYKDLDFHIAGESYAGHYIPVFASEILSHEDRSFNLASVLIGNGLTDPLTQYEYYEPMACGEGGEPSVLDPSLCQAMTDSIPQCISFIEYCDQTGSSLHCAAASVYCNNMQLNYFQNTGRSPYDIRRMCGEASLCYEGLSFIERYLNDPLVRLSLGVEKMNFQGCNMDVNREFLLGGDYVRPYHKHVSTLLELGIPILIYAGDKDFVCNWLGNEAWTKNLAWSGQEEFSNYESRTWTVAGCDSGTIRNHKHFTFLRIFDAGHMVPYDQPIRSLAMLNRWLARDYLLEDVVNTEIE